MAERTGQEEAEAEPGPVTLSALALVQRILAEGWQNVIPKEARARAMLDALRLLGYRQGVIGKGTRLQLYRGRRVWFDYDLAYRLLGGDIYAYGNFC